MFCETHENFLAYSVGGHRHIPEIEQELGAQVTFVPHLVPMTRGILGTCYATLTSPRTQTQVVELYKDTYATHRFVSVVSKPPATKQTWGSNECHIFPVVNHKAGLLIAISALDNLVKGAAGAGVQNMNVMLGLEEAAGLEQLPVYP